MTAHILTGARLEAKDGSDRIDIRDGRATVVIADSGTAAEVLVFPPGESLERGVRFRYRGTIWIITGAHRDSGLLVAEPSAH